MELSIVYRKACMVLEEKGFEVCERSYTGNPYGTGTGRFPDDHRQLDADHIDYLKNKRADAPCCVTIGK